MEIRPQLSNVKSPGLVPGFVIALAAVVCASCGLAPPKPATRSNLHSPESDLIGTWRLVLADDRPSNREAWMHSYGDHPRGYLIYDVSGHVSIQFASDPPTSPFASGNDFAESDAEARHAYEYYCAYFGTYTVDESRGIITHHVEGSLQPSYTGTDQERPFKLLGDRLELGDRQTWRRVFERVK
jgi:Lipocalin-like domain